MDYEPKPLVGYADTVSAAPGDAVTFHVSCDGAPAFDADLVRLFHGDLTAGGPGLKEEVISSSFSGTYPGIRQETYPGSYLIVDETVGLGLNEGGLTMLAMVCATKPKSGHPQALVSKWSQDDRAGWALYLDEAGCLCLGVGDADGRWSIGLQKPMLTGVWYLAAGSVDVARHRLTVRQIPVISAFNGRLALRHPTEELGDAASTEFHGRLVDRAQTALMVAAWQQLRLDSARVIPAAHFNGKVDRPRVVARVLESEDLWRALTEPSAVSGVAAAWDFGHNLTRTGVRGHSHVEDLSANQWHGRLVNTPTRGVTGYNWDGTEYTYWHAPQQYGAIHFHDDDLTDCEWEPSCTLVVPGDLVTGVYAARFRAEIDGVREEDYVPFVRPAAGGRRRNRVLYIAPTASYLAYGNDSAASSPYIELISGAVPHLSENSMAPHRHREYGSSLYDKHNDGSGVCYSSWLRPILSVRPKYRSSSTSVWQFNADLHLIDWFERMGYPVDVATDHDLQSEGLKLLRGYRVVTTATHPEYYSGRMLDALQEFVEEEGGRLMYLGGNGFYWVTAFSPEDPRVVEVRRWGGTEAWTARPGEYSLSFTGEMGGLWRNRGRPPQKLVGVGFIAQGSDPGTYFARQKDSYLPEAEWIFAGVGASERIGDFNLDGGGAAGIEIDWFDPALGSPGWSHLVASSEGHSRLMLEVRENVGINYPYMGGDLDPRVRADMVYFKTVNDGAVFSTGSIGWCGALSYNNYDNNVSRIMKNVLEQFASDDPLP